jgi:tRNA (guanosine-2'-O-)-methyltransferase
VKQLGPTDLKRLHRSWQRRTERRVALVLEGVQSPFNVGAIVRTAAALRVEHLYLAGPTASPAHPKAGKTAMGTERYLGWTAFADAAAALEAARDDGYHVVGLELADGAVPMHELVLATGAEVCVAVGNEDHGLSPACLDGCDAVAYLPQLGRVGSLNVATAAAIALYEVRRREWASNNP